jgi:hypothetical protein
MKRLLAAGIECNRNGAPARFESIWSSRASGGALRLNVMVTATIRWKQFLRIWNASRCWNAWARFHADSRHGLPAEFRPCDEASFRKAGDTGDFPVKAKKDPARIVQVSSDLIGRQCRAFRSVAALRDFVYLTQNSRITAKSSSGLYPCKNPETTGLRHANGIPTLAVELCLYEFYLLTTTP